MQSEQPPAQGGNPPLVLLPAAGRGPGMWRAQVEEFAPDFDVLTPSLGETDPDLEFSPPTAAARIAALIESHPAKRALVCGISWGAVVALQLAIDHPDRVSALVLSGGQANPSKLAVRLKQNLLRLAPAGLVVRDGGSRHALVASHESLIGWDARPYLHAVTAPTLVVSGAQDGGKVHAAKTLAHGIPNAQLKIIPRVGHLWNLSHPAGFNTVVGDFLRAHRGSPQGR